MSSDLTTLHHVTSSSKSDTWGNPDALEDALSHMIHATLNKEKFIAVLGADIVEEWGYDWNIFNLTSFDDHS